MRHFIGLIAHWNDIILFRRAIKAILHKDDAKKYY